MPVVDAKLAVTFRATHTDAPAAPTVGTLLPRNHQLFIEKAVDLINGTAAGQADVLYAATATLTASASADLDLTALTPAIGGTSNFVKVKALVVIAADANTNNVVLGAAATNPWTSIYTATGTEQVRPGGATIKITAAADTAGFAVTPAGQRVLRVANGGAGTSVTYTIGIIGTSA